MEKRLLRSRTAKIFTGVCGGLGEYFGWDPVIVRLAFVAGLFLVPPISLFGYLALRLAVPLAPEVAPRDPEDSHGTPDEDQAAPGTESRAKVPWLPAVGGVLLILLGLSFFVPGGFVRFWEWGFRYIAALALAVVAAKMLWDMVSHADYQLFVASTAVMLATLAAYLAFAWPVWDRYDLYLNYMTNLVPAFFILAGIAMIFRKVNRMVPTALGIVVFVFVGAYTYWGPPLF